MLVYLKFLLGGDEGVRGGGGDEREGDEIKGFGDEMGYYRLR